MALGCALWIQVSMVVAVFVWLHLGFYVSIEFAYSCVSIAILSALFITPALIGIDKKNVSDLIAGAQIEHAMFRNAIVGVACAVSFSFGQHRMLTMATECAQFVNGRGNYSWYAPVDFIGDAIIGVEAVYLYPSYSPIFKIRGSTFSLMPIGLGAELQDSVGFPSSWRNSDISISRKFSCPDIGSGPWTP